VAGAAVCNGAPNKSLDRSPDASGCFASIVVRQRLREIAPPGQLRRWCFLISASRTVSQVKSLRDFFQFVRASWGRYPESAPLSEWFQVRFDDAIISLHVAPPKKDPWAAAIRWERIIRVCFNAGDLYNPDMIYIFTDERPESYSIPSEADIEGALWNEIVRRQLFDAEVAIRAMSSTNKLFCYPEIE